MAVLAEWHSARVSGIEGILIISEILFADAKSFIVI